MDFELGRKGRAESLVETCDTALEVGSGSLRVFATPCMAALMEGAACDCLDGLLPEGQTSVGTLLHLEHTSATPVGLEVWAEAELIAAEGKRLRFAITAWDEKGIIGTAQHERVLVQEERFLQKAYEKL